MDQMTIVGKDGKSKYLVEGTKVVDLQKCVCQVPVANGETVPRCTSCGKIIDNDVNTSTTEETHV